MNLDRFLPAKGNRKLVVLAPALWAVLAVGAVALFRDKMTAVEFTELAKSMLQWAGGLFAVTNAVEHVLERRDGK